MNRIQPFMWRKVFFLSATFLFAAFLIVSCKKKETELGQNTINQNDILNSGIDTFTLQTFTIREDSVISSNPAFALLGSYNDPVFGNTKAEFYTQLRLEGFNPDFGDLSGVAIDSFVLGIEYSGVYGKSGDQVIEVFEINDMNDFYDTTTYYSFSTLQHDPTPLVLDPLGSVTLNMDVNATTVIGTDTIDAQLRIPLDTNKARLIMNESAINPTAFSSNEEFASYFKGLYVRTNNPLQASGDGGVFYFNLNDAFSKATIYYTQDGTQKTFDFLINTNAALFNHVEVDTSSPTSVNQVINDTISGQTEYYAQAFGSRAVIKIPGLDNIPDNAVIHKAILNLPVQHQTGVEYVPAGAISNAALINGRISLYDPLNQLATYDSFKKQYSINIRAYVQGVITGEIPNTQLILSPIAFSNSADRIIFNGPMTGNKEKPTLTILYTLF